MIIKDSKLVLVGSNADANAQLPDGVAADDLGGKTVIPGLIDSHVHAVGAGEELLY